MEFKTNNPPNRKKFIRTTGLLYIVLIAIITFMYVTTPKDYDTNWQQYTYYRIRYTTTGYIAMVTGLSVFYLLFVSLKRIVLSIKFNTDNTINITFIDRFKFAPKDITIQRKNTRLYFDEWPGRDYKNHQTLKISNAEHGTLNINEDELSSFKELADFIKKR